MIIIKKIFFILLMLFVSLSTANALIKDALYITVGNKPITKLDVVNEIKIILILNNQSYSDDRREQLHEMAVKAVIKRSVKLIEIEKYENLEFNPADYRRELNKLASDLNMDVDTLKNICESNELNFSLIEDQVRTELLWNTLIFELYKDRLSINVEEIEDQLKLAQSKKENEEFLISEIVIERIEKTQIKNKVDELKNRIKNEGFDSVAMDVSIAKTSVSGGDLGWINENVMSQKYKSLILNTAIGEVSDYILIPEGILLFKVRDKRKVQSEMTLEDQKNQIVNNEKSKILRMYSLSHYDSLRRAVAVKFFKDQYE